MPLAKRSLSTELRELAPHALFEAATDAILVVQARAGDHSAHAAHGVIRAANPAAEELLGVLRDSLRGQSLATLLVDPARLPARTRPLDASLWMQPGTYEDVAIARPDGEVRVVELSVRGADLSGGETYLLMRDVTEKLRMQRELLHQHTELRSAVVELEKKNVELQALQSTLVQAGKLAALGELAAGIAHELNQPLMAIRGYAQEVQADPRGAHAAASVGEIIKGADKMAKIINLLRTHTRKSVEDYAMIDARAPIEEALQMLARQLQSRGITVERGFAQATLPPVYANAAQLEQVFINLLSNARDAIEATGRGRGTIRIDARAQGETIEISVRDDGIGMSGATQTKAFNPFFTTKEVGRGMGLGLSLSYGLVAKLQGTIVVESELGRGTCFTVRFKRDFRE